MPWIGKINGRDVYAYTWARRGKSPGTIDWSPMPMSEEQVKQYLR